MTEKKLYDDAFYTLKTEWGSWQSQDKDGNNIIMSLTEENCIDATRYYLKLKQENRLNDIGVKYQGSVSGKL